MAKLGEVCKVSPSTKNIKHQSAWLLNLDMVEQQTGRVIEYKYVGEDDLNGSIIQFDTENVLYSKLRPNLNKVVLPQKDGFSTSELLPLRPDASVLNRDYLAVFLRSDSFVTWAVSKTAGAKMPRLGTKDLMNAEIPVPNIERQKEIAEKFKKLEQLISLRKQQLAKLDELVKARFVEMFGDLAAPPCEYPELKLVDVCADADDIKCGPFGTQLNKDEYKTKGVAVWEIPQINSGFSEMPTHFITEEKAVILNAYSIEPGDIAMSRKGNVGKCGLFPENFKKGIIHSDVLRIRVDKRKVDSCFMMCQLHFSEAVKRQIEMVSSGAIMAGINVTKLKQIKVRIPELENQRMFAAFVQRVDQQKQTVQQSLDKLELMKKALMQEYFGRSVVRR